MNRRRLQKTIIIIIIIQYSPDNNILVKVKLIKILLFTDYNFDEEFTVKGVQLSNNYFLINFQSFSFFSIFILLFQHIVYMSKNINVSKIKNNLSNQVLTSINCYITPRGIFIGPFTFVYVELPMMTARTSTCNNL